MAASSWSYKEVLQKSTLQGHTQQESETVAGISLLRTELDKAPFNRGIVNPFHRKDGKFKPCGTFRNHQGLLILGTISFTLDEESQATVI